MSKGTFAGSNITFQQYKNVILNEAGAKCTGPGGTPGPSGFTTTELGKLNIFLNQWLAGTDITGTPAFGPPSNLAAPNITGANFFPVDPSTPPVACPAA